MRLRAVGNGLRLGFKIDAKRRLSPRWAVSSGSDVVSNAVSLMKRDTRRLAKRQLTWFGADHEISWFDPEGQRGTELKTP